MRHANLIPKSNIGLDRRLKNSRRFGSSENVGIM